MKSSLCFPITVRYTKLRKDSTKKYESLTRTEVSTQTKLFVPIALRHDLGWSDVTV